LTVCATPAAMPRTGKAPDGTPQGIDAALAQRVGKALGQAVEFHWCASAGCSWKCLPEGRCDVVIGQPVDSGPGRDVAWTVPYAAAGFGLVVPSDARDVHSLTDLRVKRVGIVTGTVVLSEQDHRVARFKTREELLESLETGALDAAFLDADFAAWYLHERPRLGLRLVTDYVPRERWNMALAVRAKDTRLLLALNRALAEVAAAGDLRKIYADHGVPFRGPITRSPPERLVPDTWQRIRNRGELVVSMDPANLPYSSAREGRRGLDFELAGALAQRLELKLRIEWLDIRNETAIGELLQRRDDLVFGEAVAANAVAGDQDLAGKILYSRPYYGTGYLLVHRKGGLLVRSLAELKGARSVRLGAEAGSVADYSLRQRGYLRRLYRNQLATLKALCDGDIDHAYLWANVGWTLHACPEFKLEIVPDYEPEDHWNIAIAMRMGDTELKRHVDAALETLIVDGTVERTLSRYHVPYYDPFSDRPRDAQGKSEPPIHHAAAARGPEPLMQKVATSRHPYAGLARVRSAGELVVALDQNNLPFSRAHPKSAGLDYEIADLLAQHLGLRLRVYWAYSAHDSYPSTLTTKQLCDVILGVMPDARFAERVLYSRPYYLAKYQVVVRSGAALPAEQELMALESGVAVRGLRGRAVQAYPSTEAILQDVAEGKIRAGYVVSTRGAWLAEERWPGKLVFHSASESPDTIPLSAAVRKGDADLRDAIDRAWVELDRSGRLAQVFDRWHIPYAPASVAESRKELNP
jgi:ABC-type amino acid transport substrate-binding protein